MSDGWLIRSQFIILQMEIVREFSESLFFHWIPERMPGHKYEANWKRKTTELSLAINTKKWAVHKGL